MHQIKGRLDSKTVAATLLDQIKLGAPHVVSADNSTDSDMRSLVYLQKMFTRKTNWLSLPPEKPFFLVKANGNRSLVKSGAGGSVAAWDSILI